MAQIPQIDITITVDGTQIIIDKPSVRVDVTSVLRFIVATENWVFPPTSMIGYLTGIQVVPITGDVYPFTLPQRETSTLMIVQDNLDGVSASQTFSYRIYLVNSVSNQVIWEDPTIINEA